MIIENRYIGSLRKGKVAGKVIKIAKKKAEEVHLITILSRIREYESIEEIFYECFVFGRGRVPQ